LCAQAKVACDGKQWLNCLLKLDQAKRLDPAGDADPTIQLMRQMIQAEFYKVDDKSPDKGKGDKGPTGRPH
jgi:hypothetical protein